MISERLLNPKTEVLSNKAASTRLRHITTCAYCGLDGTQWRGPDGECWHIDHVYPRSKGGLSVASNLVRACAFCNSSKGANYGTEWHPRRTALTAALQEWDYRDRSAYAWNDAAHIAWLEQSLEEHRIALDALRQKIALERLFRNEKQ